MQLAGAAVAVIGGLVALTDADVITDLAIAESMAMQHLAVALVNAAFQSIGLRHVVGHETEQNQDSSAIQRGPDRSIILGWSRNRP